MAFATADDVAIRLGRNLSEPETDLVEYVIETVTGLIVEAVDRNAAWAEDLDPVPSTLKALCVEKAIAVGSNPSGLAAESESLGAWSGSKTFRRNQDLGIFLSDEETRRARLAVYGTLVGSSPAEGFVDRVIDLREGRDPDEDPEL